MVLQYTPSGVRNIPSSASTNVSVPFEQNLGPGSASTSSAHAYPNGVSVLILGWHGTARPGRDAVRRSIESRLRYPIKEIHESQFTVRGGESWRALEWIAKEDAPGKLLVICYFGHGSVRSVGGEERLVASNDQSHTFFDLTTLQQTTINAKSDALWIQECCHAERNFTTPATAGNDSTVEVLAAGEGIVYSNVWSTRLALALDTVFGVIKPVTAKVLDDFDNVRPFAPRHPGFCRKYSGTKDIVLEAYPPEPVMFNPLHENNHIAYALGAPSNLAWRPFAGRALHGANVNPLRVLDGGKGY